MHQQTDQVRSRFLRWVCEQNPLAVSAPCTDTVLLRDARLCGYRFTVGHASAEWMIGDATFEVRMPGRSATLLAVSDFGQRAA